MQRFTADAAHELRTPLASVRTTGELALERNPGADEFRETVSSMLEGIIRLNQTIDGLLILARTEARQVGETEELVSLPELVHEVVKLLEVVIEERRVAVSEDHDGHPEVSVCADRSFVRAAILNVLHNALKFSPPGSRLYMHRKQRAEVTDKEVLEVGSFEHTAQSIAQHLCAPNSPNLLLKGSELILGDNSVAQRERAAWNAQTTGAPLI